jgi:mono/diheme cytochrome c family protein
MNRRFSLGILAAISLAACNGQVPSTDPVVRGERYFNGLGCVKCHRLGENGNEWGPNLTLVGFRKSPEWIEQWLKNPHGWNAKTVMPNFNLNDDIRRDIVAYLSTQKGQAWREYPWRTADAKALAPLERGRLIFNQAGCVACHAANGLGGYPNNNVAGGLIPTLTLVSDGYSKPELHVKIQNGAIPIPDNPRAPAPLIRMPKWGDQLKPDEIDALVEYLFSLKPKPVGGVAAKDDF